MTDTVDKGEAGSAAVEHLELGAVETDHEYAEKLTWQTTMAVFFMGLGFAGPVACGFLLTSPVIVSIGNDLGNDVQVTWIAGAWTVASSIAFSIAGSLSDVFGRRYVVLASQVFCIVASIIAVTARDTASMVVTGTLMGVSTGLVFVTYAGIQEILPNKYRGIGIGWTEIPVNVPWGAASVILANKITTAATWKWIYYIAIMYSVVSFIGIALVYFPPSRPQGTYDKSFWQELQRLDYVGMTLYACGLTVFLVGFTWAGTTDHPWNSASVIAPIIVGFLALVACIAYDFAWAKQPLFPWSLVRQFRDFTVYLAVLFVAGMIFLSLAVLSPQVSAQVFTHDHVEIGLIALPSGIMLIVTASVVPALIHKIRHLKYQIIFWISLQTLFVALYAVALPGNKAAWMVFQCFGQSCFTAICGLSYVAAGLQIHQKDLGAAMGMLGAVRSGGGSVGIAVFSTILRGVVSGRLDRMISEAAVSGGFDPRGLGQLIPAVIDDGAGIPGALAAVPNVTPEVAAAVRHAYKAAYTYGFQRVFYTSIPFGILAIGCAVLIRDPSKYLTNHLEVHLGDGHHRRSAQDAVVDADGRAAGKQAESS